MKKETVTAMLPEIRNYVPLNYVNVNISVNDSAKPLNELSTIINDKIQLKFRKLTDEEIYQLLENEPETMSTKDAIHLLEFQLLKRVYEDPMVKRVLKSVIELEREKSEKEEDERIHGAINRISRILKYFKIILQDGNIEFLDPTDEVVVFTLNEFKDVFAYWCPDEKKRVLIEERELDQAVYVLTWLTHQMSLNKISFSWAFEDMLLPILRELYQSDNLTSTLAHLGSKIHSMNHEVTLAKKRMRSDLPDIM